MSRSAVVGSLVLALALGAGLVAGPLAVSAAAQGQGRCEPGDLIEDPGWAAAALDLATAHGYATGSGVTIAVVDSGVQADTPHLVGAVLPGIDVVGLDEENTTATLDEAGHGTVVATLAAGRTVPGSGFVGVAPGAMVLPVRTYYGTGDRAVELGVAPTAASLAAGIRAATSAGARIVAVAQTTAQDDPELRAAVAAAVAADVLVVASMGNLEDAEEDPDALQYPAAYPGVLAVGAVAYPFVPAQAHRGEHAGVAAPGVSVVAGLANGADCLVGADGVATSWATGQVAGAAALLAERFPDEGPEGWVYRLQVTALREDPDVLSPLVGWGLVQPAAALTLTADGGERGVDSPWLTRPERPVATEPPLVIEVPADPWRDARSTVAWWALVALVAGAMALVVTRARGRR